jgi:branched-chain amino acid transport system permease protein
VPPDDSRPAAGSQADVGALPDIGRREAGGWPVPVAAAVAVALLPLFVSPYVQDVVVRIAIYAIFALSLELIVGGVGLVSLGHAAFLGIGAYATILVSGEAGAPLASVLAVAIAGAAAYALFVGALSLRTRGVYFIMVTLAFAQMAYFVFHDTKLGGGSDGIFLSAKPTLQIAGKTLLDLGERLPFYYSVLAALVATYALLALLLASRFGHALAGIRVNEQRMRAAGFSTYFYKLAACVVAGALAGLAGALLAIKDGTVNPELLAWQESGAVLLMLILGGVGSLRGAVIGAVSFTLLKELYQSEAIVGRMATHWQLTLGLTIIAFVALLPKGLIGLAERLGAPRHGRA